MDDGEISHVSVFRRYGHVSLLPYEASCTYVHMQLNLTRAAVPNEKRKRAVMSVRLSADWQQMSADELASLTLSSATNAPSATNTAETNKCPAVKEEEN